MPGDRHEFTYYSGFCGIGGGTLGALKARAQVANLHGTLRPVGAFDVDPGACRTYKQLTGHDAACLDLFTVDQYIAFHGCAPPDDWRECTAEDLRRSAGGECPDVVFMSPPCKGFSSLLNSASARSRRYQALNRLTIRSVELMLQAWADSPPKLFLLENVPRIATRGAPLLDAIKALLVQHGYAVAGYTHDCGELGGLAQHRHRYLLVARHREQVPPFLYEPPKRRVRGVGEVIGDLPMPEDPAAGPMHTLPRLQWKTWVRLALIEAGKDWRSLADLPVEDGVVKGVGIEPMSSRDFGGGPLGVTQWKEPAGVIAGESRPTNGRYSVADPRAPREIGRYQPYGVITWEEPSRTITGTAGEPGSGPYSVADPRPATSWGGSSKYKVSDFDEAAGAVIAESATGTGAFAVADPRLDCDVNDLRNRRQNNVYKVVRWDEGAGAVTGATGNSRPNVADPRIFLEHDTNFRSGFYGVRRWEHPTGAVIGSACHDNGRWSVADPRPLHDGRDVLDPVPRIVSLDGTWHRPFTTLELACLQGFLDVTEMDGDSHTAWRGWIGNAAPALAMQAVFSTMLHTLLLAEAGSSFMLSSMPIWVRPLAASLSVMPAEEVAGA